MLMHCDACVKAHNLNKCSEQRGDKGIKARLTNRVWHVQSLSLIMPPLLQTAPLLWSSGTRHSNKGLQQLLLKYPISEVCAFFPACYKRVWDPSGIKFQTLRFKLRLISVLFFFFNNYCKYGCILNVEFVLYSGKNPFKHYLIEINKNTVLSDNASLLHYCVLLQRK